MVHRFAICRIDKGRVALQSLKVSHLLKIPSRFYESPKLKIWMCELCTFSQIRSHICFCYLKKQHCCLCPCERYNKPPAAHLPQPPTNLLPPVHSIIHAIGHWLYYSSYEKVAENRARWTSQLAEIASYETVASYKVAL